MAPSGGHVLVPKALRAFKFAIYKTTALIRARFGQSASTAAFEAITARVPKQPIHPLALLRQARSQRARFFTTATKHLREAFPDALNSGKSSSRRVFPQSATRAVLANTTYSPFSSTLRPSLVGGALPRTAGGYTLGGSGTRAFSSVPSAQAHVVQNVSAAVRAFCLQGFRPQYEGVDPVTNRPCITAVSKTQNDIQGKIKLASGLDVRGTNIVFRLTPAITALTACPATTPLSLADESVLTGLATDFAAARKTISQVQSDLVRLSTLGPLPVSLPAHDTIHVRFPGCDGASVSALCVELGILSGTVREDESWSRARDVEMALLFPWAPSASASTYSDGDEAVSMYFEPERTLGYGSKKQPGFGWQSMMTSEADSHSHSDQQISKAFSGVDVAEMFAHTSTSRRSDSSRELFPLSESEGQSFGFDDLLEGSESGGEPGWDLRQTREERPVWSDIRVTQPGAERYEGVEGIYRFLREIDEAQT